MVWAMHVRMASSLAAQAWCQRGRTWGLENLSSLFRNVRPSQSGRSKMICAGERLQSGSGVLCTQESVVIKVTCGSGVRHQQAFCRFNCNFCPAVGLGEAQLLCVACYELGAAITGTPNMAKKECRWRSRPAELRNHCQLTSLESLPSLIVGLLLRGTVVVSTIVKEICEDFLKWC